MKIVIILILLLILIVMLYGNSMSLEHNDSGALIQLMAKDEQDSYLTGSYGYDYDYGYYNPYIRLKKSEMPLY